MKIELPQLSLVALVGPSGSGKTTFAKRHFLPTEVVSSDVCRGLVCDDENSLEASGDAFDLVFEIAAKRLKNGRLTVIDATSVQPEDRKRLVQLAREYHCLPTAIVFDMPEELCQERNRERPDRDFGSHVVRNQRRALRRGLGRKGKGLSREGFRYVSILRSPEEVDAATVTRVPLWNDKRHECGPFDIIGDVHGCFDELLELLRSLGYGVTRGDGATGFAEGDIEISPPVTDGGTARTLVFLGDLVDRGPKSPAVLQLVMRLVAEGKAFCVPGNHDTKLLRKLNGRNVQLTHGLAETMEQLDGQPPERIEAARLFLDGLISHYVLDGGRLVVAHAGLKAHMQGRGSARVREFCLYGETTGETDEFGLPVRFDWAAEYRGRAMVVYGHTPTPRAEWLNGTICIDTGCVFGGSLTALRYPERELVAVEALERYARSARPLVPDDERTVLSSQQQHDRMLRIEDVIGKRYIDTPLFSNILVREENAAAALEVMSRFAVDPRWLIHLPPTMSPSETSERPGYLEYPDESFRHFRGRGVSEVICEEKHMGSRAILVACRDEDVVRERFGVTTGELGAVYTRTGRRFFDDPMLERALLDRVRAAATA
ncbi:MAG: polynucleotide kinase-phosphatase, partial [Planctomycetes bacterium]|nr:polynucleotide kinase-phosphatase [Planctomycetota bacterium]